jgi:hypothetical protein
MPGGVRGSGGDPAAYSIQKLIFQLYFQQKGHKKKPPFLAGFNISSGHP